MLDSVQIVVGRDQASPPQRFPLDVGGAVTAPVLVPWAVDYFVVVLRTNFLALGLQA
jgi:hypothetical protein